MEIPKLKEKALSLLTKYKYVIIVLIAGIALVLLPNGPEPKDESSVHMVSNDLSYISQEELASTLTLIDGAGRVEVLLSLESSAQTQYQQNTDSPGASNERSTTVTVTDAQRNEIGLVNKTWAPIYRGAIVICDGAENAQVHLNIISAVANITGLRSDQITVLKMK